MDPVLYTLALDVRDYECDLQGVVNNAVYQNYLEHARHLLLKSAGIDFAALSQRGINLVVTRAELDYLFPLRSGDHFEITTAVERVSRLRFGFHQEILRLPDHKPILRAFITGTALDERFRPHFPAELGPLFPALVADDKQKSGSPLG